MPIVSMIMLLVIIIITYYCSILFGGPMDTRNIITWNW